LASSRVLGARTSLSRSGLALFAAATALVAFAPSAHADEQSDFLGCLTNHGLQITDRQEAIDVGEETINYLRTGQFTPDMAVFSLEHQHGASPEVAQIEVQCAQAAILMNGH